MSFGLWKSHDSRASTCVVAPERRAIPGGLNAAPHIINVPLRRHPCLDHGVVERRAPRHGDVDRLTVFAREAEPLAGNEAAVASQRLSLSGEFSHRSTPPRRRHPINITVPRYYAIRSTLHRGRLARTTKPMDSYNLRAPTLPSLTCRKDATPRRRWRLSNSRVSRRAWPFPAKPG
jgi:hypothetical protein